MYIGWLKGTGKMRGRGGSHSIMTERLFGFRIFLVDFLLESFFALDLGLAPVCVQRAKVSSASECSELEEEFSWGITP